VKASGGIAGKGEELIDF